MNYKSFLINIPWTLIFIIFLIVTSFAKFYFDTKHLKALTKTLKKAKYSDFFAATCYEKYIKTHPFSIYNDTVRTLMIPPSVSAISEEKRKKLIKNNYLYFVPEQLNDFIIFCCFILKEYNLDEEYKLFLKRIVTSKKKILKNKIQEVLSSTIEDNLSEDYLNSPILKGILYFNTAILKQNLENYDKNEYFKKSYEACGLHQMKDVILKRGGKIE